MKDADTQAKKLEAEIVPLLADVEEEAVEDVVQHVAGALAEQKKGDTERKANLAQNQG